MTVYAFAAINNATSGGVYYCADFTTSGAITWTKLTTTGLPSTEITHFRVDYKNPLARQYVRCSDECIYARNDGNWYRILDHATAAAITGELASGSWLRHLYTDPTVPGSVYCLFMSNPLDPAPQGGSGYVMKSLDYGASWTAGGFAVNSRARIGCVEAIGNNVWCSAGKDIIAAAAIYYSPDGGTTFYGQGSAAGSTGTANLRINPAAPNKVYAWGDGGHNEWTCSGGVFSSRNIPMTAAGGRPDQVWFDFLVADRVLYHAGQDLLYSTDNFGTYTTYSGSEPYPAGTVGPYNIPGSTALLSGLYNTVSKTVAYLTAPSDLTADERGGANTSTPPYTDSVPNVVNLAVYGIWWGTPPAGLGVMVYADEQGDIDNILTYDGLGYPMFGDRSSWRDRPRDGLDIYHAEDVQRAEPQIHAPWDDASPPPAGYGIVSDGSHWVTSTDEIVLDSDLHDAVTLDADAALILDLQGAGGQELGLDVQNANVILAGPTTGAANEPTFRALVLADLPPIALDNLSDVIAPAPFEGDALLYDSGSNTWINGDLSEQIEEVHQHTFQEIWVGNGVITKFFTANEFESETTQVYLNGLLQRQGSGHDYVEDAGLGSITFTAAPEAIDTIQIGYILTME